MFSLTIDDPNCDEVYIIKSSDENDFIQQVWENPLVDAWLDDLCPENCPNFDEDIGYHSADDLVDDIQRNMPEVVELTYDRWSTMTDNLDDYIDNVVYEKSSAYERCTRLEDNKEVPYEWQEDDAGWVVAIEDEPQNKRWRYWFQQPMQSGYIYYGGE